MPKRLLKGSCIGRAGVIPFSLDEASQGTLVASLQLGSAEPQCAKFGPGSVAKDVGIAGPGTSGVFKAARVLPGLGRVSVRASRACLRASGFQQACASDGGEPCARRAARHGMTISAKRSRCVGSRSGTMGPETWLSRGSVDCPMKALLRGESRR